MTPDERGEQLAQQLYAKAMMIARLHTALSALVREAQLTDAQRALAQGALDACEADALAFVNDVRMLATHHSADGQADPLGQAARRLESMFGVYDGE